jgi:hypothetical protein
LQVDEADMTQLRGASDAIGASDARDERESL